MYTVHTTFSYSHLLLYNHYFLRPRRPNYIAKTDWGPWPDKPPESATGCRCPGYIFTNFPEFHEINTFAFWTRRKHDFRDHDKENVLGKHSNIHYFCALREQILTMCLIITKAPHYNASTITMSFQAFLPADMMPGTQVRIQLCAIFMGYYSNNHKEDHLDSCIFGKSTNS